MAWSGAGVTTSCPPRLLKPLLCATHCWGCEHSGKGTDKMPLEGRRLVKGTDNNDIVDE